MKKYFPLLSILLSSVFVGLVHADGTAIEQVEPEELIVYNRILAKVNSKTVSVVDVMKRMDLYLQRNYPHLANSKIARFQFYSTQWKEFLNQIIEQELMIADAEKLEIKVSEAEVREEILNRFGPNIMPVLDKLGLTYEETRAMIHDEMIVQRMTWFRINSKALNSVNPADVKEAYKQYCEKNPELEEWQYQVLSIRSPQKEASAALAKRAFDLLQSQLPITAISEKLKTETEEVTISLSNDLQADEKSISDSHKAALKSLTENSFSEPIAQVSRTDNSVVYRIFHLKKHSRRELPPFEKMADQIKEELLQQAANKQSSQYMAKLRAKLGYDEKQMLETLPVDFQPFAIQ